MSKSLTARLISAAGLGALVASSGHAETPPTPTPAPAPNPGASADGGAVEGLSAEAQEEVTALLRTTADASRAAGFADANARAIAVFESDAGKANPALACFMLAESQASSDVIIEKLAKVAPAPAAAATEPTPPAPPQPTVTGMEADPLTPAPTRAPGASTEDDSELQNSEVFPGVDFSGKSAIVEDQGGFGRLAN